MIHRTYLTKDTTIFSGSEFNGGGNPILKLIRGSGENKDYSRILFELDLKSLYYKIKKGELPGGGFSESNPYRTHTLRFYNTMFYNRDSMGRFNASPSYLPASYKLQLLAVRQKWDEGRGYDYLRKDFDNLDLVSFEGATFKYAQTGIAWGSTPEEITSPYFLLDEIEVDLGVENIEFDLSIHIERMLNNFNTAVKNGEVSESLSKIGVEDFLEGFMLRFTNEDGDHLQTLELFGKDTHTYFEPHLETSWDFSVNDNRFSMPVEGLSKLYCYTSFKDELVGVDRDSLKLEIFDDEDILLKTIQNPPLTTENKEIYDTLSPIKSMSTGIYYTELNTGEFGNEAKTLYDVWTFMYEGTEYKIQGAFATELKENLFKMNLSPESKEYNINFSGIRRNEKIKDSEKRKLTVTLKDKYNDKTEQPTKVTMDFYVKVGSSKVFLFKDSILSKNANNEYYDYFDFSWVIPHDYFIDINIHSNGEIRTYEVLDFSVIDSRLVNKINGL